MGLFRRSQSPHWWVSFSHHGRQYRISTGTTDRKLAETIAAKVRVEVDTERWFPSNPASRRTFRELMDKYLAEHSARNKKPMSAKRDRGLAKHLLAVFGSLTLAEIMPAHIAAYQAARRATGVTARTVNLEVALARHALNLGIRQWQWCSTNPFAMVIPERVPPDLERWLTIEEEAVLLPACPAWLREVVIMALHTGMRLGEIRSLRWTMVDLPRRRAVVQTVLSKTSRARTIPLNRTARTMLAARALRSGQHPEALVFCTSRGTAYTGSNVERAFREVVNKTGLARLRLHDLRHTFATRLVQKGVDLYTVQRLLGHTTPAMTQRYAHHSTSSLAPAVGLLDEPDEVGRVGLAQI